MGNNQGTGVHKRERTNDGTQQRSRAWSGGNSSTMPSTAEDGCPVQVRARSRQIHSRGVAGEDREESAVGVDPVDAIHRRARIPSGVQMAWRESNEERVRVRFVGLVETQDPSVSIHTRLLDDHQSL
jgi:hypothetical protein